MSCSGEVKSSGHLGTCSINCHFAVEIQIELFELTGISQYPRREIVGMHIVVELTLHTVCECNGT